jgi:hypothetical protein
MTHPSTTAILRWFEYSHLRSDYLQEVSKIFHDAAYAAVAALGEGPETTVMLRRLLEAKDASVRAAVLVLDEKEQERLAERPSEETATND